MKTERSPKEISVDKKIISALEKLIALTPEKDGLPLTVAKALMRDQEIEAVQITATTFPSCGSATTITGRYTCAR